MLGIDATFGDVSFDRDLNPPRVLLKIIPGAAAVALAVSAGLLVGCVGAWVLHMRPAAAPAVVNARPAPAPAAPAGEVAANPFGDIIIDPSFLAELRPASLAPDLSPLASLEAAPPAPSATIPPPENAPLPPKRAVPQIVDIAPLPPPRPPEFGPPATPAPDRHLAQPTGSAARPPAPADNRNFFQK